MLEALRKIIVQRFHVLQMSHRLNSCREKCMQYYVTRDSGNNRGVNSRCGEAPMNAGS
jgi:hypothetical protein